jgi:transcriptional repressor NrdR
VICPLCESQSRVLESRAADSGAAVRRRRECTSCGHRFTTRERYEQALFVRKRNGRRQPFERQKLRDGLARAAHKRNVSEDQIDAIADHAQTSVIEAGGELPTSAIGELCLEELRDVDRGAYLQYLGTLSSQIDSAFDSRSQFAGSLGSGSVRSASNPAGSRS